MKDKAENKTITERFFSRFHYSLLWKGKSPYSDREQRTWEIRGHYVDLESAQDDIRFLITFGSGLSPKKRDAIEKKCKALALDKPITFFGRTFLITRFEYKERKGLV